jgi:predicted nuclease of predicted toxin-antitoxin system
MAKLYSDEDFSYPVVQELRLLGHDVVTAQDAGQANLDIADSAVLAFAIAQNRAVLTHNRRDFINLHRNLSPHEGIIVCTRDDDVTALALRIHQAVSGLPRLNSQLLRINRPQLP